MGAREMVRGLCGYAAAQQSSVHCPTSPGGGPGAAAHRVSPSPRLVPVATACSSRLKVQRREGWSDRGRNGLSGVDLRSTTHRSGQSVMRDGIQVN